MDWPQCARLVTKPHSARQAGVDPQAADERVSGQLWAHTLLRMLLEEEDEPIRGQRRCKGYRRVSHGLFLKERDGLSDDEEFRRDLKALLMVLPEGAVFTHVTGARLRGWDLPKLPEQVPVFAAAEGDCLRPRRPGLICSRLRRTTSHPDVRLELPVDSAEEILLRCARDLGHIDLVILVVSALRAADIELDAMRQLLLSRRPGVVRLRAAWNDANAKLESVGEVVLYLFHRAIDVPVEPQVPIHDDAGVLLGVVDLLVIGTRHVHEYDGAGHRDKLQHRTDLRRERGWAGTEYVRRGYTLDDLLNHAGVVMHEIDRALDRPHDSRRLQRWRALVDGSMYSEPGRERVMNRWHRIMGIVDWS